MVGLLWFCLVDTAFPSNHCLKGLEVGGAPGSGCPPMDPYVASDASNAKKENLVTFTGKRLYTQVCFDKFKEFVYGQYC